MEIVKMGKMDLVSSNTSGLSVQGFAPRSIQIGVTTMDVTEVGAIRVSVDSEYYIGTDSGNKATMLAGSITVIATEVNQLVFSVATVVEVM